GAGNDTYKVQTQPAFGATLSLNGNGGIDTLVGPNINATWSITNTNAGSVAGIAFSNIQNLAGGTGNDLFHFSSGKGVNGTINGGTGKDSLDFSAYTTGVTVNLTTGTATGTGGVANIENITGSPASDSLTGSSASNVIYGDGGTDVLKGGAAGSDT